MTYYYDVWVSTNQFRESSTLTYFSTKKLQNGLPIIIPFRNKNILGLIKNNTSKPSFKVKEIIKIGQNKLPTSSIKLLDWMLEYYPTKSSTHLQLFLPRNILNLDKKSTIKEQGVTKKHLPIKLPVLTKDQKDALKIIDATKEKSILIHGNTGSGKTRVYVELIKKAIGQKKSAIVLVPEIGLSPQITATLEKSFPEIVITIHSGMSEKKKRQNWQKIISSDEPLIVVGPRSALFVPLKIIGVIILDEAHDASYKQESSPFYQTTRVAAKLSELTKAKLILGTATPLISDYYYFKVKKLPIVRLTKSAKKDLTNKLDVVLVNLNNKSLFNSSKWLSDPLIESISRSIKASQQSLVFLNRRGTAIVIICQNCGWRAICPNCNTSLTYHQDRHSVICHSCGFSQSSPSICPVCSSSDILFKGAGTKALEHELKKLFPSANIKRFDRDSNKLDSLEENYTNLADGKVNIIIGTQIITKGLDLPKLSTVGIVMADHNLVFPDYIAEERSFQSLSQVIGRVGRGHVSGRVIIQTYNPSNLALVAAINKDYSSFYESQIKDRQLYNFPPYVFLLKIYYKAKNTATSEAACNKFIREIRALRLPISISEPNPAFHEKVNSKYIWQVVIKSKSRDNLLKIISIIPNNWFFDLDPYSLL
ncbi:MAG TPA: primosomal protein N' [Candidatus Saccharimonadia bacterium]|nr:primosomal protein N' [Candidatus Saccharimonadia bacterium]